MKFQLKSILTFISIATALALTSCTKDDSSNDNLAATGKLSLEFSPAYKEANLTADTPYTNSNGEIVKISTAKFIVSNIVLTKADGSVYTVPKSESYFIVDALNPEKTKINLSNIPAGNYTKITYGIGVDKEQFDMGATGQGNFLTLAESEDMIWNWSAGYRFVIFEGTYTKPGTVDSDTPFEVHVGLTGTDYNYTTATVNLPQNATVTTAITPKIRIKADLSQITDGVNKFNFTDNASIAGGSQLPLVVANLPNMFNATDVNNN